MKNTKRLNLIIGFLCLLVLPVFAFNLKDLIQNLVFKINAADKFADSEVLFYANSLSDIMRTVVHQAKAIARDLEAGKATGPSAEGRLRRTMVGFEVSAAGIVFSDPGAGIQHSALAFFKDKDLLRAVRIENDENAAECLFPRLNSGDSKWFDVFTCPKTGMELVYYAVSFKRFDGASGKVFIGCSLKRIREILQSFEPQKPGILFLLSPGERVITPDNPPTLKALKNDDEYSTVIKPLTMDSWQLGIMFPKEILYSAVPPPRKKLISLFSSFTALIFLAGLIFLKPLGGKLPDLIRTAVFSTNVFIVGTLILWYAAMHYDSGYPISPEDTDPYSDRIEHMVLNRTDLGKTLLDEVKLTNFSLSEPIYFIPTKLHIQAISFVEHDKTIISGYIWQMYSTEIPKTVNREILFPDAESTVFTDMQRFERNGTEYICRHFRAELCRKFDCSTYPIDRQRLSVDLFPADLTRNIILIPDFDSDIHSTLHEKIGMESDLEIPGWQIEKCFFSYSTRKNSKHGFLNSTGRIGFPELSYCIILRRKLMGPFVINILPLSAVFFFAFVVLLMAAQYDVMSVLTRITPLLFVVVVAHVRLRGEIPADGIIYIEYLYVLTYLAIAVVSINSLLLNTRLPLPILRHGDNLAIKLAFCPIAAALLFCVSIIVFY